MKWEKISNMIGVGLVAVCFVFALGRILILKLRESPSNPDGHITLRLAHFQLEGGVREAVDAIAAEYTKLHPGVRITQIPIPSRIAKNWRITQLVGGTPPDIIQTGAALRDEELATYFLPLGDLPDLPNPYNRGTELEGTPVRETFFDGMESGYNEVLADYYGLPSTTSTIRMFFNLDLLREITGSEQLPKTYVEFLQMCEATKAFAERTGRHVVPVSGSDTNSKVLMDYMFNSQTQRLHQERINKPGLLSSSISAPAVVDAYWQGKWSLDSPEIRSGLDLVRVIVNQMQPGFAQLQRDDAFFYFVQGGAVTISSGSWDASSLTKLAPFPLAAGILPVPDRHDPVLGEYAYGPVSEAHREAGFTLGIPADGKHPEVARDFLLFMTSKKMNELWTRVSDWPPAVVGVKPSEIAQNFIPLPGGYPPGISINGIGADNTRLYANSIFRMTGPGGSVDRFVGAIRPQFSAALASDMKRLRDMRIDNLRRTDSLLAAHAMRADTDPATRVKLDGLIQAKVTAERSAYSAIRAIKTKPSEP